MIGVYGMGYRLPPVGTPAGATPERFFALPQYATPRRMHGGIYARPFGRTRRPSGPVGSFSGITPALIWSTPPWEGSQAVLGITFTGVPADGTTITLRAPLGGLAVDGAGDWARVTQPTTVIGFDDGGTVGDVAINTNGMTTGAEVATAIRDAVVDLQARGFDSAVSPGVEGAAGETVEIWQLTPGRRGNTLAVVAGFAANIAHSHDGELSGTTSLVRFLGGVDPAFIAPAWLGESPRVLAAADTSRPFGPGAEAAG